MSAAALTIDPVALRSVRLAGIACQCGRAVDCQYRLDDDQQGVALYRKLVRNPAHVAPRCG